MIFASASVTSAQTNNYTWQRVTSRAPFLERDGAGIIAFNSKMWLLGGWNPFEFKPNGVTNEIWSSTDGYVWNFEGSAPWSPRHLHGRVVFQDKIWIICGDYNDGTYKNDVWNSPDGVNWTKVIDNAPWGGRVSAYVAVFNNKIWLMGGEQASVLGDTAYNDIWNSDDGINWQRVVSEAPWAPRAMILGSAVLNNRIWIYGGGTYTTSQKSFNDVWSSSDGISWDSINASPPWRERLFVNIAAFDNKLWVLDGYNNGDLNDVWYSSDGSTWNQLSNTPWPARHAASVVVFDSSLWITAGRLWNDVWRLKPSTLVMTSPAGGSVKADTVVLIQWESLLGGSISLDYSRGNSNEWMSIASGIPVLQKNYTWHRSLNDSVQIRLRIRSDSDTSVFDIVNIRFEEIRLSQGLSAFYPLNSNTIDESENGLDGTSQNLSSSTDRFGNASGAVSFDGISSIAVLPAQNYTPFDSDFTISFWEQANTISQATPLSIGDNFENNLDIVFNTGGIGLWPLWNGGGTYGIRSLTYPGQYTNNQWHHVVLAKRDERVMLFVDGRYQLQTVYSGSIGQSDNIILGQSSASSDRWTGSIDEIRIYDRCLNDQEISEIYNFVNHSPVLSSEPDTFLTVNQPVVFLLRVADSDTSVFDDKPSVQFLNGPSWLQFDSVTGNIYGIPKIFNTGDTVVELGFQDLYGNNYIRTLSLNISYPNTPPYFINLPDTVAYEDSLYKWEIHTGDLEAATYGDQVHFKLMEGPSWITLDTVNGTLSGTPSATDVGDTALFVRIYDWTMAYEDKIFTLSVKHINHPPIIETVSLPAAFEDSLYYFRIYASDKDSLLFGDVIRYHLSGSPTWLTMDSVTGVLSGLPMAWDVGDTLVTVAATDGKGGESFRVYEIRVNHVNHAPYWVIVSKDTIAKEDSAYASQVFARDQDSLMFGDYLRYRILQGPFWLTLDSVTGTLSGTPPNNTEGDTLFYIAVTDNLGSAVVHTSTIRILPTNYPPGPTSAIFPAAVDTMTIFKEPVDKTFIWTAARDPDHYDTVSYVIHLKGAQLDTIILVREDTSFVFNEGRLAEKSVYTWHVIASDGHAETASADSFEFRTTRRYANATYDEVPIRYRLFQNYPNPFNNSTDFRFQLPEESRVRLELYNILGQKVATVFHGQLPAQYYELNWSANGLASGLYVLFIKTSSVVSQKTYQSAIKILLIK